MKLPTEKQLHEFLSSEVRAQLVDCRRGGNMTTNNHYFIELEDDGKYAVKTANAARASGKFNKQKQAIDYALELNPDDHPDVERVKNTEFGRKGEWRPHNS